MTAPRLALALGLAFGLAPGCGPAKPPPPAAAQATTDFGDQHATRAIAPHAGHARPLTLATLPEGAQLFDDLGTHHRPVTTARPEAQAYFDQGLRLLYGFNHDEAARSFAKAAAIDPTCAMCYWGVTYALGPNYNVPMLEDRFAAAWEALELARRAAVHATPVEQALITALARRHRGPAPHDAAAQAPLDRAYAEAMREVAKQHPNDLDVQVLAAEALMDLSPWQLWAKDGTPAPATPELVALLERVLARDANHPGANHYYIHAVEASPNPGAALPSAERLGGLMPGAGHILHMPAHIFQRVGRYADASAANRAAIDADRAYLARTTPPGYYAMYIGHNYGFLAFSASMEGRSLEALEAARESAKALPPEMVDMMPGMDFLTSAPLFVMVRFGKWDELLGEPRPDPKHQVMTGLWLHAHGMALAAKGRVEDARAELDELHALIAKVPEELRASHNRARDILTVGAKALEARIADKERSPAAPRLWAEAVALEDQLAYAEPADWFYPLRHFQGAALLAARRPKDAEAVYRKDLALNPANGWALQGLVHALEAQRQPKAASEARRRLDVAWARADIRPLTTAL